MGGVVLLRGEGHTALLRPPRVEAGDRLPNIAPAKVRPRPPGSEGRPPPHKGAVTCNAKRARRITPVHRVSLPAPKVSARELTSWPRANSCHEKRGTPRRRLATSAYFRGAKSVCSIHCSSCFRLEDDEQSDDAEEEDASRFSLAVHSARERPASVFSVSSVRFVGGWCGSKYTLDTERRRLSDGRGAPAASGLVPPDIEAPLAKLFPTVTIVELYRVFKARPTE